MITATGVTKSYGPTKALVGASLQVARGEVYGLLGPNGAGKTTLLRAIMGLVRPDAGVIRVLGQAPGSAGALAHIGAMIESPAFVPGLSGRVNLRVLAKARGVENDEVDRVLDAVDLGSRSGDRFSVYSLGMRQRLGVAAALLGDPDLMILDEPSNGLDPDGIVKMRELLRELGARGKAVLVSSHMLHEVEQTCDRVMVMKAGGVIAEGTVASITAPRQDTTFIIAASPVERVEQVLGQLDLVRSLSRVEGSHHWECLLEEEDAAAVVRILVNAGVDVHELTPKPRTLEDDFLLMTSSPPEDC